MTQAGHAQSVYGTIAGNVTDSSQAAIVNARVVATNPATGFTRETLSNSVGVYSVPDVLPGAYTVEVSAPGFQIYKRTGVTVSVQTLTRVDVALSIGATNGTVTVSADAAELQTDRTDVRSDLTSHTLENAPVPIGRNYQMLFVTIPGVSPPTSGHSFGANPTRSLAFTVNGGNINNNDTRVDGAGTRNFGASDTIQYIPSMEAIETVSVATNSFDADQSTSGAAVNVTVKSGTNSIHGSVFEDYSDRTCRLTSGLRAGPSPNFRSGITNSAALSADPLRRTRCFTSQL